MSDDLPYLVVWIFEPSRSPGCTVQTPLHLDFSAMVELRIYLVRGSPGAIGRSFSAESVTISAEGHGRLETYLATSHDLERA